MELITGVGQEAYPFKEKQVTLWDLECLRHVLETWVLTHCIDHEDDLDVVRFIFFFPN